MVAARPGTRADFEAYVGGRPFPHEWCVTGPEGMVFDEDGEIVGVAMLTVDELGRKWLWFNERKPLSPMLLHRTGQRLLAKANGPVYVFIDPKEPRAADWAMRSGFAPAGMTTHPTGEERMAWRRA